MTRTAWAGASLASIMGLAALFAAGQARAAVSVFANDTAKACYMAAKFGDPAQHGVDDCTDAIMGAPMSSHDLAGTYVNRGVVYMVHRLYRPAQMDFEAALKLDQGLGEAWVNHGAALIALHQYAAGVAEIDRGLPLGPDEPEKAYYNRALADEALNDVKQAYYDYLKASELKPSWDAPKAELARFTVRTQ